jgi:hypothetical protein
MHSWKAFKDLAASEAIPDSCKEVRVVVSSRWRTGGTSVGTGLTVGMSVYKKSTSGESQKRVGEALTRPRLYPSQTLLGDIATGHDGAVPTT